MSISQNFSRHLTSHLRVAMAEQITDYCSVSVGPNIAFVVVSFGSEEIDDHFEDIKNGARAAIKHSISNLGLDHVRVTVIIPPGCRPCWKAYVKAREALSQIKFEFYNVNVTFECASASNFLTFYERAMIQAMCIPHGVTWIGSLTQRA